MTTREGACAVVVRCILAILLAPVLYLLSAGLVFDFSSPAWDNWSEGKAHGPSPRLFLCHPTYYDLPGGASWEGTEWAFVVYRPVCSAWLRLKGLSTRR